MRKKILLIGCGGHTKVCIDVIKNIKSYKIAGVVCDNKKGVYNLPNVGNDNDLKKLRKKFNSAFITIGQIKNYQMREKIFKKLKRFNFNIPRILSNTAIISKSAKIDKGTIVMDRAIIHQDVKIGKNCIINTGAIVEHDVQIGDNTHISTGAIINGEVEVGKNVFIGSGTIIVNNVKIKSNSFIKAGTLIKK